MYSRRKYTIVVVSFDSVGRVDLLFDKSNTSLDVVQSWRTDRSERAELAEAVIAGLRLAPEECGRVYILTNEFWSGQVALTLEIVDAITEDQLDQTLALEAELETGISPFDSRMGHVLVETAAGTKTWWVTQAESTELDALEFAVREWPGNLSGISSTTTRVPTAENGNEQSPDTKSADACARLATEWLTAYLADNGSLPVIHFKNEAWTEQSRRRISLLITLGILSVCVAFHFSGSRCLTRANTELSELVIQEKQLRQKFDNGEKLARRAREAIQYREASNRTRSEQLAKKRQRQGEFRAIQDRPVQLLRALLLTTGQDHYVHGIKLDHKQAIISGFAIDSTAATTLSQRLESKLDSSKWLVKRANMSFAEAKSLVLFEITLVPRTGSLRQLTNVSHGSR